jgi:HEAT repeat protein
MECLQRRRWNALICILALVGCTKPQPATRPADSATAAPAAPAATKPAAAETTAPTLDSLMSTFSASSDGPARVVVIDEIAKFGQRAKPALDELVKAFGDEDSRVRWHAARAVGLIGEDARSALPALVALLADSDPIVVTQAAAAIGCIQEDDGRETLPEADAAAYAATIDPLMKTALHPDGRARRSAMRALRHVARRSGKSREKIVDLFADQLADADPSVVLPALHTLADMEDEAVPFLLESLQGPKSRYWATLALAEIGPKAAPATEPLAALAKAGETEERLQAILALASIGEKAAAAAPVLVAALDSDDDTLRHAAAFALGSIRCATADESLRRAAAGSDPFLASVASWALARIHPDDAKLVADAVGRLRKDLDGSSPFAHAGAASALSDLAPVLTSDLRGEIATELADALGDADPKTGIAAGAALVRLGADAVAALRPKLGDAALRRAAMDVLAAIGPAAKPALDDMITALADAEAEYRAEAALAIAAIGPDAAAAVPALRKNLADESAAPAVRYAAAFALGRIGPAAIEAEALLRSLASAEDETMATVAVWAALKVKPEDKSLFEAAVPRLRRALRGDREMARLEAAAALGDIGPAAEAALPILELVSEEDDSRAVRAAAAQALAKIRGK